ncbi:MAG: hypothetical protein AAFW89_02880 [Bacteroidota bacterium]
MSLTLPLARAQAKKDKLFGKAVTFTTSLEYRIGLVGFGVCYLIAQFIQSSPRLELLAIPVLVVALIFLILAFYPMSMAKRFGDITLSGEEIRINPSLKASGIEKQHIPVAGVKELSLYTAYKFRWFSSLFVIQAEGVTEDESSFTFAIVINSRKQEQEYLEILDNWYRQSMQLREYDQTGQRIFKLNHGFNYEDIQGIKEEYGINW